MTEARSRQILLKQTVDAEEKYPWLYAFYVPSDYVIGSEFELIHGSNIGNTGTGIRLDRLQKDSSRAEGFGFYQFTKRQNLILTNLEPVDIIYTRNIEVEEFGAIATNLLIHRIAYQIVGSLNPIGSVKDRIGRGH